MKLIQGVDLLVLFRNNGGSSCCGCGRLNGSIVCIHIITTPHILKSKVQGGQIDICRGLGGISRIQQMVVFNPGNCREEMIIRP